MLSMNNGGSSYLAGAGNIDDPGKFIQSVIIFILLKFYSMILLKILFMNYII